MKSLRHPSLALPLAALLLGLACASSPAATYTWSGGGSDSNFGTAANWVGGVAPGEFTAANTYVFTGTTRLSPIANSGDWSMTGLIFDAAAGSFNILGNGPTGQRLSLHSGSYVEQDSASSETISAYLLMATGTVTVQGSGSGMLTLAGIRMGTGSSATLAVTSANTTIGIISEQATGSTDTIQTYPGVALTFSDTTTSTLANLKFNVDGSGNGGSATTIQATNASGLTSTAAVTSNDVIFAGTKAMTFSGNFTQAGSGDETVTFNNTGGTTLSGTTIQLGAVNGTGNRTITYSAGSGATATLSGAVTGSASTGTTSLAKTGTGTLVLSGSDTYNGTTSVNGGKLKVTGSISGGAVSVASGATLAGTGTIATLAGNSIAVSGTLAPGDVSSIGTINFTLNSGDKLNFLSGSTLALDVATSTADTVAFATSGDWLSGAGNLTLALAGTINYAATYTVFSNVTTSGFTLAGITGYDTTDYAASFSKSGSQYLLSFNAVPEPDAAGLLPLGGLALWLGRRRLQAVLS